MTVTKDYLAEPETRVTNAESGGQKGAKLTQVGALDPVTLIEVARVAGMGANKYSAYNFMKGTDWSLMFNAMQRHALRFWSGEDMDPESGHHHMAHAAWMALALVGFALRETGTDDRPPAVADKAPAPAGMDEPGALAGAWSDFYGMALPTWVTYGAKGDPEYTVEFSSVQPCCGKSKPEHTLHCLNYR